MAEPPAANSTKVSRSRGPLPTIVVDTREQLPFSFDVALFEVVRRALPAGDYSLQGHEHRLGIERKSLDDYVGSVIASRERFGRELHKLAALEFGCVVVEGSLDDVMARRYRSGAHPNAILGATTSIIVDRKVPVFFCSDRQIARRFVESILRRFTRTTE